METITEKKALLRQQLKAARAELSEHARQLANSEIHRQLGALPEFRQAKSVFCYVSLADEVDSQSLIHTMLEAGKKLFVPRITEAKTMIAVALQDWEELSPGELGILTPCSKLAHEGEIEICITPGLGFSESGQRIGFGRGYYDRWFTQHPNTLKIALAYECQIVSDIPAEQYDICVDMIISEKRLIQIRQD